MHLSTRLTFGSSFLRAACVLILTVALAPLVVGTVAAGASPLPSFRPR